MAGLVPAIHVFLLVLSKTWMPGNADKFTQSAQARLRAGHDEEGTRVRSCDRFLPVMARFRQGPCNNAL